MAQKTCPHCKRTLDVECFYTTHGWCKECNKAAATERRKSGPPYRRPYRQPSERRREAARVRAREHYRNLSPERKAEHIRRSRESQSSAERHELMFGGLREETVKRDGYCCARCGMTRQAHKERFGFDLNVHHINGVGRRSPRPDNRPENLLTLCQTCHSRLHAHARKVS